MGDFDRLQEALPAALAANVPGSAHDHVVVAMASYSLSESCSRTTARGSRRWSTGTSTPRCCSTGSTATSCSSAPSPPTPRCSPTTASWCPRTSRDRMERRIHAVPVDDPSTALAGREAARPPRPARRDPRARRRAYRRHRAVERHRARGARGRGPRHPDQRHRPRPAPDGVQERRAASCSTAPASPCRWAARTSTASTTSPRRRSGSGRRAPTVGAVVVKHDDSGAGDGNAVVHLRDDCPAPHVTRTSCWPTSRRCRSGSSTTSRRVGESSRRWSSATPCAARACRSTCCPAVASGCSPPTTRCSAASNGQVYLGCRFPADPSYAADLATHGDAVGRELAARGCAGRAGVDFMAARTGDGPWSLTALEVNLRKGGTTHPFSALRSLVPGHYDTEVGALARGRRRQHPRLPLHRQLPATRRWPNAARSR